MTNTETAAQLAAAPAAPHALAGVEYRTCCDHPDCVTCKGHGGHYRLTASPDTDSLTVADYEEVLVDHRRLVRELDILLNGKSRAAEQASLCDIVRQVRSEGIKAIAAAAPAAPHAQAEPVAWIRKTDITELTDSEPETNGWTPLYAAPAPQEAEQASASPAGVTQESFGYLRIENEGRSLNTVSDERFWATDGKIPDGMYRIISASPTTTEG